MYGVKLVEIVWLYVSNNLYLNNVECMFWIGISINICFVWI